MKKQLMLTALIAITILFMIGCQNTYVTSARVYLTQNSYDKAIEMCKIAIEQNPADPDAWYELGRAYGMKQEFLEMKNAFDKSLEAGPKNELSIKYELSKYYSGLFNSATQMAQNQQLDEAIAKYEIATQIEPKRHEAYLNLASTYMQAGKDSMVADAYIRAMEQMPDSTKFAYNLGITYYNNGKYEKSIAAFQKVVDKEPEGTQRYFEATFNMANGYAMLNKDDEAMQIYEKALKQDPTNTAILFNMGRMNLLKKDFLKAIEVFKKIIDIDPNDVPANMAIGNAYLNHFNNLSADFNAEMGKLTPTQLEKQEKQLKETREGIEEVLKEALPYFEKAAELSPEETAVWQSLGIIYTRTGEKEKAEAAFAKQEELLAK